MVESSKTGNFEFVKKFSYRDYTGVRTRRLTRIFSLATFEMINTWKKSLIGKILLGFILVLNVIMILVSVPPLAYQMNNDPTITNKTEFVHQVIFQYVASYLSISNVNLILPSVNILATVSYGLGFLIIALLAIAGSGFFADDKQGKVIEIYLSRMKREDYAIGKFLGMFLYCNLFITLPFLVLSVWIVQGLGQNQLDYIGLYLALGVAGAVISMLFTVFTLLLSSFVEKRAYASLSFFIGYMLFDSLSIGFYVSNPNNQLLLLLVPSFLIALFIFTVAGDFNLGLMDLTDPQKISPLILNDGIGLEWWHVIGLVLVILLVALFILLFKIHRMTTNEL